jgi:hypothetical protein
MERIDFSGEAPFVAFHAVEVDGRLSDQLASEEDIDRAAADLKRQIDLVARRMKAALQKPWAFSPES